MIFLFLIRQCVSSNQIQIGSQACTCVNTSGFCDAPCRAVITKKEVLPMCNKKNPFHQSLNLSAWLINEIFCIMYDRRHLNEESYNVIEPTIPSDNNGGNGSVPEDDSGVYKYSKPIKTDEGNYYLPTPFLASAECHYDIRPLEFLVPIDYLRCYYKYDNQSEVYRLINQSIPGVTIIKDSCREKELFKSIDYSIIYDDTNQLRPIELQLRCTPHDYDKYNNSDAMIPLQIGVHFYNQTSANIINKTMKSGEAGYSHGKPLIVRRTGSSKAEPFPIPHGYDCSNNTNIAYTPLIFGYDTISGCTEGGKNKTHIIDVLKTYTSVSKMGKAHGNYNQDWIDISNIEAMDDCSNLVLTINYEYVGNLRNPQNKIYNASYRCDSNEEDERFIFLVNYLRSSDDKVKPFIPKPKGLPDDTFAPII